MSFGDGNLHERCEQYRRQVGGLQASLGRVKRERDAYKRFAEEAWGEIKAWHELGTAGGEDAFYYGRLRALAVDAGIEPRWGGSEWKRQSVPGDAKHG